MDPPISLLNEKIAGLDFNIDHQQDAVEDLEEVRKKAEELQQAVANEFDDLVGFSDEDDYGDGTATEESGFLQAPQMGFVGATSTPITEAQNCQKAPFQAGPGYTMATVRSTHHVMTNGMSAGACIENGLLKAADRVDSGQMSGGNSSPYGNHCSHNDPTARFDGGGDTGNFFGLGPPDEHELLYRNEHSDQYVQLQVMYKARMRELERVAMELENLKQSTRLEITSLQEDLSAARAQQEHLLENLNQARQVIVDKTSECAELSVKVSTLENQLEVERNAKEENVHKMRVAESTIKMLQEQLSELNRSDSLVHIKRDYDNLIRNMKEKHQEELFDMKQQTAQLSKKLGSKVEEVQRLKKSLEEQEKLFEAKLLEKSDTINRLTHSLNISQKQCQVILENGPSKEKDQFVLQLKMLEEDRIAEYEKIKFLEEELAGLQKLFRSTPSQDRNPSSLPYEHASCRSTANCKMKLDVNEAVFMIKMCRQEVARLQAEFENTSRALQAAGQELEELRKKSRISEDEVARLQEKLQGRDGSETESQFQDVKSDELVRKIKSLEEKMRELDVSYQRAKQEEANLRTERETLLYTCATEKAQAVEVCKDSILEMHHAAMKRLREELLSLSEQEKFHLAQEYEARIKDLNSNYQSLQQTIDDVKELYIRSCEEKHELEERIQQLMSERETVEKVIEGRLREEFKEVLQRVRPVWENEMMKSFQERLQEEIRMLKEQWATEHEAEIDRRVSCAEESLGRKFQEEHSRKVEELSEELKKAKANLDEQAQAFSGRESQLKCKLVKFQKKLQKVEKQHQDELLTAEKVHSEKLTSLQNQLKQLSQRYSENTSRQNQVCSAEVLDRWTEWFRSSLDSIYGEIAAYTEEMQKIREMEVHEALRNYHQFLLSKASSGGRAETKLTTRGEEFYGLTRTANAPHFPPTRSTPEKPYACDARQMPRRDTDRQGDTDRMDKGNIRRVHASDGRSRNELPSLPTTCATSRRTLPELNLSDISDGSVFLPPPGTAVV